MTTNDKITRLCAMLRALGRCSETYGPFGGISISIDVSLGRDCIYVCAHDSGPERLYCDPVQRVRVAWWLHSSWYGLTEVVPRAEELIDHVFQSLTRRLKEKL